MCVWLRVEEGEERGGEVPAEWVGLVGPVEPVGAPCVAVEVVFGLVVVFEDVGELVLGLVEVVLRGGCGCGCGGREGRRESGHGLWLEWEKMEE